jgi:hypothetical protein
MAAVLQSGVNLGVLLATLILVAWVAMRRRFDRGVSS